MSEEHQHIHRVVVLTALPVEYDAVRVYLSITRKGQHKGTQYEQCRITTSSGELEVILAEIGQGNVNAAIVTERMITHFNAKLVIFVGVAGGLKDVQIGDVVIADKVYWYESGKAEENYLIRPKIGNSTYSLEQLARNVKRDRLWLNNLQSISEPPPQAYIGAVAAGENVVASTRSDAWKLLKNHFSDALAVEMEGYGVLDAVRTNEHVGAIIIRGISDLVDHKADVDAQNFQAVAARHASAFTLEILKQLNARSNEVLAKAQSSDKSIFDSDAQTNSLDNSSVSPNNIEFLKQLETYWGKLNAVCSPFYEGRTVYPDHCQHAVDQIKALEEFLQRQDAEVVVSKLALRLKLDNLLAQIKDVRQTLQEFRRQLYSPQKGQAHHANLPRNIHDKITRLLDCLKDIAHES